MCWSSASGNRTLRGVDWIKSKLRTLSALASIRKMGANCIHRGALTPQRTGAFSVDPNSVVARANGVAQVNGIEVARDRDNRRVLLDNKGPRAGECF